MYESWSIDSEISMCKDNKDNLKVAFKKDLN